MGVISILEIQIENESKNGKLNPFSNSKLRTILKIEECKLISKSKFILKIQFEIENRNVIAKNEN